MLKEHLKAIKGELVLHFAEGCFSMSQGKDEEFDYENYYEDMELYMKDILNIRTLDDLDIFISESDLDGMGMGLDYFYSKYCGEKLVTSNKK